MGIENKKPSSEGNNYFQDSSIISENTNCLNDNSGYVKIFRNILDWEWYSDLNTRVLFLHCLLKANGKTKKWKGKVINAGQFITSLNHLALETGLTLKQVRVSLAKLKTTNEMAYKGTSQYSIITINNWEEWQTKGQTKGQTEGKQRATTKNNIYNNKEENKIPTKEEIKNYCLERKNNIDVEQFYLYYSDKEWKNKDGKPVNWKLCVITWEKNDKKYNQNKGGETIETEWNPHL